MPADQLGRLDQHRHPHDRISSRRLPNFTPIPHPAQNHQPTPHIWGPDPAGPVFQRLFGPMPCAPLRDCIGLAGIDWAQFDRFDRLDRCARFEHVAGIEHDRHR